MRCESARHARPFARPAWIRHTVELTPRAAILVADEPTGNLDSRTSVEIMQIFQRLNEERNITILLVTHETDIARFAKRVVLFRDGRVRKDTPLEDRADASEVENHRAWLTTIVARVCLNMLRSRTARLPAEALRTRTGGPTG